jgi:hypothetical protein
MLFSYTSASLAWASWLQILLPLMFILFIYSFIFVDRKNLSKDVIAIVLTICATVSTVISVFASQNISSGLTISNIISSVGNLQYASRLIIFSYFLINVSIFLIALSGDNLKKGFKNILLFSLIFAVLFLVLLLVDILNLRSLGSFFSIIFKLINKPGMPLWNVYLIIVSIMSIRNYTSYLGIV